MAKVCKGDKDFDSDFFSSRKLLERIHLFDFLPEKHKESGLAVDMPRAVVHEMCCRIMDVPGSSFRSSGAHAGVELKRCKGSFSFWNPCGSRLFELGIVCETESHALI